MASGSLRSQLRVSHEGKKDDADNVEDKLEEFIPLGAFIRVLYLSSITIR